MILDNYNIYAEKNNTYEVDPYTQESIGYINELKEVLLWGCLINSEKRKGDMKNVRR